MNAVYFNEETFLLERTESELFDSTDFINSFVNEQPVSQKRAEPSLLCARTCVPYVHTEYTIYMWTYLFRYRNKHFAFRVVIQYNASWTRSGMNEFDRKRN